MENKIFKSSDKIYLFHNKRCSKSREVKKYLDENNVVYNIVDYLNVLPDGNFLKNVLSKLENNFEEIIRINENIYKTLKIDEKADTLENMINLIIKHPILMQRPIVTIERDDEIIKSIICRPTEIIKLIFD
tara:strand:+ start:337 stop:729 length:393 start_codon:yes stop_codon:yes gene_type:complete